MNTPIFPVRRIVMLSVSLLSAAIAQLTWAETLNFDGAATPGTIYQGSSCAPLEDGVPGTPCVRYVEGRSGQALEFGKRTVVAVPLSIDPREFPQITITAWIRRPANGGNGGFIVSDSGIGGLPYLSLYGGYLSAKAGRSTFRYVEELGPLPRNEWIFIAGIWDYTARTLRLQQGESSISYSDLPMDLSDTSTDVIRVHPTWIAPDRATGVDGKFIFIGGQDFKNFGQSATDVAIDQVNVFTRALSDAEIATLAAGNDLQTSGIASTQSGAALEGDPDQPLITGTARDPVMTAPQGLPGEDLAADVAIATGATPPPPTTDQSTSSGSPYAVAQMPVNDPVATIEASVANSELASAASTGTDSSGSESPVTNGPAPIGSAHLTPIAGSQGRFVDRFDLETEFIREMGIQMDIASKIRLNGREWTFNDYVGTEGYRSLRLFSAPVSRITVCKPAGDWPVGDVGIFGETVDDHGAYWLQQDGVESCDNSSDEKIALCPAGEAATGLVLHSNLTDYSDFSTLPREQIPYYLVGVQLICRRSQ